MFDVRSRREAFPSLEGMTYLNTAAEGIPPRDVQIGLERYFNDKLMGSAGRPNHFFQWDRARELTGRLFGISKDEVGICSCSSEAFNLLGMALHLRAGDEIVVNDLDFPAGRTPWLQPDSPAEVRLWRSRDGALHADDLAKLLGPRTRLVSTSLVSYYNGFVLNLPEVVATVRRHCPGLIALDVTQALGRIPLSLSGVDFIVSSTHKWILSTHGGGLVGVPSARAADLTAPAGGWFNLEDPFERDPFAPSVSKPGAASYMVGMPNFPAIYAIAESLAFIDSLGVGAIDRFARPLVESCLAGLKRLPVEVLTPSTDARLAGILAFRHKKIAEIFEKLSADRIYLMHSAGRLRISLHAYNTQEDVEKLLAKLTALVGGK